MIVNPDNFQKLVLDRNKQRETINLKINGVEIKG